jgi:Cu2+-exporting ATPase
MGSDCCDSPAPATEPAAVPIAAPIEKPSSCQESCCDGGDSDAKPLETKDPGQGEPNKEELDDCCSSGKCADDKAKDDTDKPDCCRGKVGPCCNTSCLDRLAMRECEVNAVASSGANAQTKSQ